MAQPLIAGVTGQHGPHHEGPLLSKGYKVHGIVSRSSSIATARIDRHTGDPHAPAGRLHRHHGGLAGESRPVAPPEAIVPYEAHHPATTTHVRASFERPETVHCSRVPRRFRRPRRPRSPGPRGWRTVVPASEPARILVEADVADLDGGRAASEARA